MRLPAGHPDEASVIQGAAKRWLVALQPTAVGGTTGRAGGMVLSNRRADMPNPERPDSSGG